jgi:hypothetical protein
MIDEIGFIREMRALWEAMEPIASRQQDFRVVMATTPPDDDTHFAYELAVPPEGLTFEPNAKGHWYDSQAGIRVHRVDVHDAALAGVKLWDLKTRQPVTPEKARANAIDRDAWDRNYLLIFKSGGAAAVSLAGAQRAMELGHGKCISAENEFPPGWRNLLTDGPIAVGADPATTEGQKSNPFAIVVAQEEDGRYFARLVLRFKTSDPEKARAYLREALELGTDSQGHPRRARRLVIDATSERFWAAETKSKLSGIAPIVLVVASEKTAYLGEEMIYKTYLGNLLVNTLDDLRLAIPETRWVKDDFRSVFRSRGGFECVADSSGNHGDCFDATKLALHGLIAKGGPVQAAAAQVGTYGLGVQRPDPRRSLRPPDLSRKPVTGLSMP